MTNEPDKIYQSVRRATTIIKLASVVPKKLPSSCALNPTIRSAASSRISFVSGGMNVYLCGKILPNIWVMSGKSPISPKNW
jgi:hypothetical protein